MKVGALYKDSRGWGWKHTMVAKTNCHKYVFLKPYDFELQPSQYWKEIHKLYSK
jgi:transposase